jgi:hypothetical protein
VRCLHVVSSLRPKIEVIKANKPVEAVKQIESAKERVPSKAKAGVKETDSNNRLPSQSIKNVQTKRVIEHVDLCSDDEEGPLKVTKIETSNEQGHFANPACRKEGNKTDANRKKTETHSAIESTDKTDGKAIAGAAVEAAVTKASTEPVQTAMPKAVEKGRKRKEMMEELEDVKLQQKINQLERALRKLDEE